MNLGKPAVSIVLAGAFAAGALWAQDLRLTSPRPQSVSDDSSYNYYSVEGAPEEQAAPSPSDLPAADVKESEAGGGVPSECGCAPCASACRPCPSRCGFCSWSCCGDDPWTLPQPCFLQCLGVKMGGWLEQGVTFNAQNPSDGFNGPVATNDMDSHYQMNQLWLFFDRPADTSRGGFAIGGHVDMLLGTDWRFGINHGLEDRINSIGPQDYGMVIPQMYLEAAFNRLSVKLGHFATILDYEAVPAPPNPFYSHSYSYCYTGPQLVTGALADYKLTDQLSMQASFHRGWMMFEDFNDDLDFMGGVKWQSDDKRTSLAYSLSTGPQDPPSDSDRIPGNQERFVYSFVAQRQVTERLRYVLVHNLGVENNALANGRDAEWYGLNQYFLYTINPCWAANLRVEWLRDDDGARVAGPASVIPVLDTWNGSGYAGNFYELTCGLHWRPHANLLFRPEIRWDWYRGLPSTTSPKALPFDGGLSDDQFTFAVDAIISY